METCYAPLAWPSCYSFLVLPDKVFAVLCRFILEKRGVGEENARDMDTYDQDIMARISGSDDREELEALDLQALAEAAAEADAPAGSGVSAWDAEFGLSWHVPAPEHLPRNAQAREQENRRLVRAMRNGDQEARDQLIVQNIALVFYWANVFAKRSTVALGVDDMCSEGTIGLMKAVEKFDPDGDKPFAGVAGCWIKQAIRRALVKKGHLIKLPERLEHAIGHLRQAQETLRMRREKEPTEAELAAYLTAEQRRHKPGAAAVTVERVRELMRMAERPLSLDQPVGEPDEDGIVPTLGDKLAAEVMLPHEEADRRYMVEQLMAHLDELPPRDQRILRVWAGFDEKPGLEHQRTTLDELAAELQISRERVRQLRDRALRRLGDRLWEEH